MSLFGYLYIVSCIKMDRPPLNESEREARLKLVAFAKAMIYKELPFFEGAPKILSLKDEVDGITDSDQDFNAFVVISSETEHLPLEQQEHLWSQEALAKLEPEFSKTEEWANTFAPEACKNIIARFSNS